MKPTPGKIVGPLALLLGACTGFSHSSVPAVPTGAFPATWNETSSRTNLARRERLEAVTRRVSAPAEPAQAAAPARRAAGPQTKFLAGSPQPAAYALVVGIERYRDAPAATGATIDAERYAALATQTLGIPASHVHVLRDDRATGGDIDKELSWLASNVPARGRVYFFFSGHGAPDPSTGASYLVPYDGDPKALEPTAFAMPKLLERLSASRASEVFAVVDACFSGAGGRSVLPAGMRPLVAIRETKPAAKVALFTASSGAQTSGPAPDGDGGLFSKVVAEGIGTGKADIDGDGLVSLQELQNWVAPRVEREARSDRREQSPSLVLGADLAEAGATPFAFVTNR